MVELEKGSPISKIATSRIDVRKKIGNAVIELAEENAVVIHRGAIGCVGKHHTSGQSIIGPNESPPRKTQRLEHIASRGGIQTKVQGEKGLDLKWC